MGLGMAFIPYTLIGGLFVGGILLGGTRTGDAIATGSIIASIAIAWSSERKR
jgi:hypothetical protein